MWGSNNYGQLGIGNETQKNTPQFVTNLSGSNISYPPSSPEKPLDEKQESKKFSWQWLLILLVLIPILLAVLIDLNLHQKIYIYFK